MGPMILPLAAALLVNPLPPPNRFREVSVYLVEHYVGADKPFRLMGPDLVFADSLRSRDRLEALARTKGVVIEVCEPKVLKSSWTWPEGTLASRVQHCVSYPRERAR